MQYRSGLLALLVGGVACSALGAQAPAEVKTSEGAQRAIAASISAALQGDGRRAREALARIPAVEFAAGRDADYRACMLTRFAAQEPAPLDVAADPFVLQVLSAYTDYWHRGLMEPAQREAAAVVLRQRLTSFAPGAADRSWDALEQDVGNRLLARGYYSQLGETPPLRELMIWRKQESRFYDVELPEGSQRVRVEQLDDFVALGWSAYARCNRGSNGGWVGTDRIFAVMPALSGDDAADAFNASLLGHETQHFADQERFPGLEAWELEYRAKLTELWMAKQRLSKLLATFATSQSDERNSPHTYANKRVMNAIQERLRTAGRSPQKPDLSDVEPDTVRATAREALLDDSRRRQQR